MMNSAQIIASLKGVINSTTLSNLNPDEKSDIRKLLAIIELNITCPCTLSSPLASQATLSIQNNPLYKK
jgi:hypothetical protein